MYNSKRIKNLLNLNNNNNNINSSLVSSMKNSEITKFNVFQNEFQIIPINKINLDKNIFNLFNKNLDENNNNNNDNNHNTIDNSYINKKKYFKSEKLRLPFINNNLKIKKNISNNSNNILSITPIKDFSNFHNFNNYKNLINNSNSNFGKSSKNLIDLELYMKNNTNTNSPNNAININSHFDIKKIFNNNNNNNNNKNICNVGG